MTPNEPRAVPEGMVPWHGGDRAPDDWDGGPVQLRGSSVSNLMLPFKNMRWSCKDAMGDIIAYTPRPTEQPAPEQAEWDAAVDGLAIACSRINGSIDQALRAAHLSSVEYVGPAIAEQPAPDDGVERKFYDEGWNARVRGEPFPLNVKTTRDWRDGWRDCDSVEEHEREIME